jgi:hypothetical protein
MNAAKLEYFESVIRAEHPTWSETKVFEAAVGQSGHRGGFTKTPVVIGRRSVAAKEAALKRTSLAVTVAASRSDDVVGAIAASHPDWSRQQCEHEAWEKYWT